MQYIPTYLELGSTDPAKTSAFFSAAFDWPYNDMGQDGGWFDGPTMRAGLHGGDPVPQIYVYFAVDDLPAAIDKVRTAGGHADEPGPDEPGFGRFANCKDPTGIAFGLHERPK